MKKFKLAVYALVFAGLLGSVTSGAQMGHDHGPSAGRMKMDSREVLIDGLKLTFQIMANSEHRKMLRQMKMKEDLEPGTTHNVTLILTDPDSGNPVTGATVAMKVIDPKGQEQIKNLKFDSAMKSFDAYFKMAPKGRYELLVLIKTGDRKKTAGTYYDLK